ncbi:MAG: DUF5106 domain-containing protein [Bacteroidales bacterium]|nr:DUF5106 domain-containing protein [Bacteroidales bacterium]
MKRLVIVALALFFVTVEGLFVLSGCNNGSRKEMPYQTNIFPQVKVPLSISADKRLAAEFSARHYWDEFLSEDRLLRLSPDASAILGISPQIFEESFSGYVSLIENVDDTIAKNSMTRLVDRAVKMAEDGYPLFFSQIMQNGEKYLFDAHSPFLDDELYLPVLAGIEKCKVIPDSVKQSFRYQADICNKNRVGTTAADFRYTSQRGSSNMHSIKAEYLLIFFNDPDCPNCRQALEVMKKSDVILNMVGMGVMKVLAVSPGGKSELWAERRADFPMDWIYAYDPVGELNQGTIYTLRTSPSIYLLDENKNVIIKDASLPHCLRVLTSISEHYVAI